jgi:hypothetical protein
MRTAIFFGCFLIAQALPNYNLDDFQIELIAVITTFFLTTDVIEFVNKNFKK